MKMLFLQRYGLIIINTAWPTVKICLQHQTEKIRAQNWQIEDLFDRQQQGTAPLSKQSDRLGPGQRYTRNTHTWNNCHSE